MLANLLPGLREIRAPVVSGYLWLTFFFLLLHSDLPSSGHPGSTLQPLFDLAADLSVLGVATIASVAAYLTGSAMQEVLKLLSRLPRPRRPLYAKVGAHTTPGGRRNLVRAVRVQVARITRRLYQVALSPGERGIDEAPEPEVVVADLPSVRTLLIGEHPELAGELDRLQAEADLRITVSAPLAVLSIFLAFEQSWGWALGLVPAVMLAIQGFQRQREAGDFLAGVLQMGRIEAPAVKEFEISVEAALERTNLEWQLKGEMADGDGMAAFRYANLLASSLEFEKAIEPLGVAIDHGVLQGYAELGFVWMQLEEPEKAERAFRDGAERGDLKARERLAELLRDLQRNEEALEAAGHERSDMPDEPVARSEETAKESDLDLPRPRARIADYRSRAEEGDAKAALNLGLLLARTDETSEAIEAFRMAADLDPEDPQALIELGRAEFARFRFVEARAALERALKMQEEQLSPSHLEVGMTLVTLGMALSELGHDERALAVKERALEIQRKELDPNGLEVVTTEANLGQSLLDRGRFKEALNLFEKVIESETRLLGGESMGIAVALNNRGSAKLGLGDYRSALIDYERSLKLKEKLKVNPRRIATTLGNIAHARSGLGEYERALRIHEKALRMGEEALGPNAVGNTDRLDGIGEALTRLGRYEEALAILDRSWGIKEAQGASELRVAYSHLARAEALAGVGSLDESIEVGEKAQQIFGQALGKDNPLVAHALVVIGESLLGKGKLSVAERLLGQAVQLGEESDDERDFWLPRGLLALAKVAIERGDPVRAEALASEAIRATERRFGPLYPDLADALEVWAGIREAKGEAEAASVARLRAAEIRDKSRPNDDHPSEGPVEPQ